MRALALIYSHRVPGFKETQIGYDPIQKKNLNPQRKQKTRLSVDRPRSITPVDRTQLRAKACQSVDRAGRLLLVTVDRSVDRANLMHVVHTGRLPSRPVPPPVDRAVDRGHYRPATCAVSRSLCLPISVLSSDVSSISSLPTEVYKISGCEF